jgi:hypothetical protein
MAYARKHHVRKKTVHRQANVVYAGDICKTHSMYPLESQLRYEHSDIPLAFRSIPHLSHHPLFTITTSSKSCAIIPNFGEQ